MAERKEQTISALELFSGCRADEIRTVAEIGDVVEVPAGCSLAQIGSRAREFVVVLEGRVIAQTGRHRTVLGAGSHFGALELIDGRNHARDIKTGSRCRLLVFETRAFRGLLSMYPVARKILGGLASMVPAGAQYRSDLRVAS